MRLRRVSRWNWAWVALVAGLGLLVAVIWDLEQTLARRGQIDRDNAQRAAEWAAREFLGSLLDPETLEHAPPALQFAWKAAEPPLEASWVIPPEVGWLEPEVQEPLAPLVETLVRRAETASEAQAEGLWKRALEDPACTLAQSVNLRLAAAWQAFRAGWGEALDQWLVSLPHELGTQATASRWWLQTQIEGKPAPNAVTVFEHLELRQAEALGDSLVKLGLDPSVWIEAAREQDQKRQRLRAVATQPPPSPAAKPSWRVLSTGDLAVFFPELQRGRWWTRTDLETFCKRWEAVDLLWQGDPEPNAETGGRVELLLGYVALGWTQGRAGGPLQGPVGWAVLVAGLAGLCGGAAWLALRSARREAQSARLRGEFLTTVTHELKTPLAGIRLVSEMLADDHVREPSKRKQYLLALSAESTRLSMLIENVLDLRRMERGERANDARRENMAAVLLATVELFAPLLERSQMHVVWSDWQDPLWVVVDPDDLRQAFLNVLDNARKYGGAGSIQLALVRRGNKAVLCIQDQGPGVPVAEREAIFERFTRGSLHQNGGIPGVGIGLNLARAILRRQGGDLIAPLSHRGQGAYFELHLPLDPSTSVDLDGDHATSQ